MAARRPATIPEYIAAAPAAGKPHLEQLYAILKDVAPEAQEAIKWGTPFFVEPRFLFAFSGHKAHAGFTSSLDALEPFRKDLTDYEITNMGILKIPYNKSVPEPTIRKIARARAKQVKARKDSNFW